MTNTLNIARRELASFLLSPVAYIILVVFYVAFGLIFYLILSDSQAASMEWTFAFTSLILTLVIPVLTMRQIAEERRLGTLEGLMTTPVTHTALVVGKFLGAAVFFIILLLPSALHSFLLFYFSTSGPDKWALAAGYIGLLLLGCFMLSFGLFCSSLTRSQVAAAMIGVFTLFLFWLLGQAIPQNPPAALEGSTWQTVLKGLYRGGRFIAYRAHFEPFLKGAIDLKHVIFFVSFTVFFLFLAVCTVANRKWR